MKKARHVLSLLLGPLVCAIFDPHPVRGDFGDPLPALTTDEIARFEAGRDVFEEEETAADGLGPVFNEAGCGACHNTGATGGGSERTEARFGSVIDAVFDPLENLGGSLVQDQGIGAAGACEFVGEVVPEGATVHAQRRTTPLFGLGLVEAVDDDSLRAIAAMQRKRQPALAGRPHVVTDVPTGKLRVGRFGWKSQIATLQHFAAEAYLNEMGITTPLFPVENCPQGDCTLLACDPVADPEDDGDDVDAFADFMRLLAPSPATAVMAQRTRGRSSRRGSRAADRTAIAARRDGSLLFDRIGCASCHVRTLTTGDNEVSALRFRSFHPFSDFLLHDMAALGDGIVQGDAEASEMRTAPLWGLRLQTTLLHDGRATTIADAILAHDGQARPARDRFAGLDVASRTRLLAFLADL